MSLPSGWAIVQVCNHDKVVAAHVLAVGDDDLHAVFDFFGLTPEDWVANRWRFYIWETFQVRAAQWCSLHSLVEIP